MALNFPSTPATNDTFSSGGITWTYNGSSWTTTRTGAAFDALSDVDLTGAANNDLIYRSAGNWVDTGGLLTWDGSTLLATSGTLAGSAVVALSNTLEVQGTFPFLQLNQTDGGTNEKKWNWIYDGTSLEMRAVNDASNAYSQAFVMTRTGYAISALTFGNATDNPTFTFSGTGLATVGGNLSVVGTIAAKAGTAGAPSIHFSDTTTGIYKAGADTIGFTTGGVQRLIIDSSGISSGVAKMYLPGGSAGAPTYSFLSDSNSGMYGNNSGSVYIVSDGTARLTVDSSGITVNGTVSASSIVSTGSSMEIQGSFPYLQLNQTDGGTDEKKWVWICDGTTMELRATNDASNSQTNAFTFTRSAQNISNLTFGNTTSNPTFTFAGTGAVTISGVTKIPDGSVSAPSLGFTNNADVGLYYTSSPVALNVTVDNSLVARFVTQATGSLEVYDEGAGGPHDVGFRDIPQNSQATGYTLALADRGKHIAISSGNITIPANSSVAFPIGSAITIFRNAASSCTIAITTDTLRWAGTATTGTGTLAQYGTATVLKVASTTWVISGTGLT